MDIFFYTSSAEPNSFPKVLGSAIRYQGELRDECDILNPVLTIEGLSPDTTFNYCYIPDFKRYYFITESSVVRTGLMEFILHVDVLQSWSSQILEQEGVILRNEYDFNSMITDELVNIFPDNTGEIIKFARSSGEALNNIDSPSETNSIGNIVLITTGHKTTS